jgi:hypothetical protein
VRPSITHQTPQIQVLQNHTRILSGNVDFGKSNTDQAKNIQGWHALNITTPATANTDFPVPVSLGYIPDFFQVTSINANAVIYKGVTPWTAEIIYLRCSVASAIVSLFIH